MIKNNIRVRNINDVQQARDIIENFNSDYKIVRRLSEKAVFRVVEIKDLDARAANILKYESLECGADAIISNDVIMFTSNSTDVLLIGTIKQFESLYFRLKTCGFNLPQIAEEIKMVLIKYDSEYEEVTVKDYTFNFNKKTNIMGILNITDDSFYDGGKYNNIDNALKRAIEIKNQGADILDIGAESSRPGSEPITESREIELLLPIIEKIIKNVDIPISVDTYKSKVAHEVLKQGVHIINDITGFKADEKLAELVSDYDAMCILMHMQGDPKTMQSNPSYEDVISDISKELKKSIKIAQLAGIKNKNIVVDPGIGFGKNLNHNLEILNKLSEFKSLGFPILIGASRKSFIGTILDEDVSNRLEGSLAVASASVINGASILRVHDVVQTKKTIMILDKILNKQ